MDINRASLEAIFRTIVTAWSKGLEWKPPIDISFLFGDYPSTSAGNFYAFLHQASGFRKWVGDRVWNNLRSGKFEVVNEDYEKSDLMPANDIADDQYGVYAPAWQQYAAAWQQKKYDLVINTILDNDAIYDGLALFADTHAYGDNTIDNLTTSALSETTFNAAFLAAAGWKFANGEYCRPVFTHLCVGEKLRSTGFNLVENEYLSLDVTAGSREKNPNYKRCQLVVLPEFIGDYDDYWMLVAGGGPLKPIARQVRKEAKPVMDLRPEEVELTGEVKMFAHGRGAARGSLPHLIYGGRL